jgi:hypothetical protein
LPLDEAHLDDAFAESSVAAHLHDVSSFTGLEFREFHALSSFLFAKIRTFTQTTKNPYTKAPPELAKSPKVGIVKRRIGVLS